MSQIFVFFGGMLKKLRCPRTCALIWKVILQQICLHRNYFKWVKDSFHITITKFRSQKIFVTMLILCRKSLRKFFPILLTTIKSQMLRERVILAPKNNVVNEINILIQNKLHENSVKYNSIDTLLDSEQVVN